MFCVVCVCVCMCVCVCVCKPVGGERGVVHNEIITQHVL